MGEILKDLLKTCLLKFQCHFTWNLLGDNVDIDSVEERLHYQTVFLEAGNKHRMYNLLAYLKYLRGDHDDAMLQLHKADVQLQQSNRSEETDFKRIVMYGNYAWLCYHQNQLIKGCTYSEKVEAILKKYESTPMHNTLLLEICSEQGWAYLSFTGEYYERAAECFEKALELDPENPELNSGYAMAVYRIENFILRDNPPSQSLPFLERAVKLNPKDTVMKAVLALKYQDLNQYKEGEMLIEQALQEDPESPYVLRYAGKFYRRTEMIDKAIVILNKAISLTPTSSALHYQLGLCYRHLIKKYKQLAFGQPTSCHAQQRAAAVSNAKLHFEKAAGLNKTSVMAHILLGSTCVKAHEFQKAEEAFCKALTIKNITWAEKQELHLQWAQYELFSRKSEPESIKHYKEAIRIKNPTLSRAYAIKDLERLGKSIVAREPANATGYGLLGFIYHHESQDKPAIEYYEKALQLDPDNPEYIEALLICNSNCNDLQASIKLYKEQ